MMKRIVFLSGLLLMLLTAGLVFAQSSPSQTEDEEEREISFEIESEIGRALPRNIIYDENFERMAVIDAYGRLMLVDALTYQTQHILYERGTYNDLAFSHDGHWLALAIESRIELYDTNTGQLVADLVDLGQAIRIIGPLAFSRDDNILQFQGIYPAPRSIRISENDTVTVPWLWNLTAARNEGKSTFPRELEAWQFFDYRNGFVIGPDDRIVAALPGRLQVLDAYSLDVLFEIPTDRYERDPLTVWFSFRDNKIYVRPVEGSTLLQVDTQRGVLVEIPLYSDLTLSDLELVGGIELSDQARVIGEPNSRTSNDLLRLFLGERFRENYNFAPLTVTLIDLIIPPAVTGENITALLFVFDERREIGRFVFAQQYVAQQMVLSRNENQLLVRQNISGEEYVVTYDLNTGEEIDRFIPALRAIGSYNRALKNRVLAYDQSGTVIISDFQRIDAEANTVLAEDLRYSRRFDRFFFTQDNAHIVTLSGSEWRLWNVTTGEVERREVVRINGSILSTSSDGFRFLSQYSLNDGRVGVEVIDMEDNTRRSVDFDIVPGSYVDQVIADAAWEQFFVIYSANEWGQYYPGNQVAMYSLDDGYKWLVSGDDLPPVNGRSYGWVDENTVYISGSGYEGEQPARVYEIDYDSSGLPACIVDAFPDQITFWGDLWERLVWNLRPDSLSNLAVLICADLPETAEEVQVLLLPTATPPYQTPEPITISGVPVCLTAKYPDRAEEYAWAWQEMIEGLTQAQIDETANLLCEGIGRITYPTPGPASLAFTMMIDAETGERATGSFAPIQQIYRPIQPILDEFFRTEERSLGTAILSPNEELIASSSLPGELIVYRMVRPYQSLLDDITATAAVQLAEANLIGGLPSPTPTYNLVGTPRPTLTPTVTPTPIPRPTERVEQAQFGETLDLCPAEQLRTLDNLPEGYSPTGRIVAQVQGDNLWQINPLTGRRAPDATIPNCGAGVNCTFSPDRSWILAQAPAIATIYVIRPDGTDERILFGTEDSKPGYIEWSGANTLEYEVTVYRRINGRDVAFTAYQRDILGVFPDPEPWIPEVVVNEIPAQLVYRQPGGPWVVAYTVFSTGVGPGYKYYLVNIETGQYTYFARSTDGELSFQWDYLGERLFYYYPALRNPPWYQIDLETLENRLLGTYFPGGIWSNEGRYVATYTSRRTQPIAVWDSETGLTRTYCIPETGARSYSGSFNWSPDSRYLALQAGLPKDEDQEGVGQHTLILDIETGYVVDLTAGLVSITDWSREPGTYGGE